MSSGDTQPTLPLGEWTPAAAPKKRRGGAWLVAFAIVALLAVGAWFAGEWIARSLVVSTIRTQITENLALPAGQHIDVDVPGAVLPQVIGGTLGEVRVSSEDVALGVFEGDIAIEAFDVPIRGGDVREATAVVRVDEDQLRSLMSSVDRFPSQTLGFDEPDVTASLELSVLGASVPVGISLTPSASEGDLVLTPASVQVAGADISTDELKRQFGIVSNAVLRDWPVCIRQYLPAALTLTDVRVDGEHLVATFDVAETVLSDTGMQENGTC